jgi:hypothetical protein
MLEFGRRIFHHAFKPALTKMDNQQKRGEIKK